jgi:hypothetical protein
MARALKYLLMPQRAHRVVVSSAPVILHRKTREVLRVAFVVPRAVDEVHDVVDLTVGGRAELRLAGLGADAVASVLDKES